MLVKILNENAGNPLDGAERCPQVMGNGIGERFHVFQGRCKLGSALLNPLLQFQVQAGYLRLSLLLFTDVSNDTAGADGASLR